MQSEPLDLYGFMKKAKCCKCHNFRWLIPL